MRQRWAPWITLTVIVAVLAIERVRMGPPGAVPEGLPTECRVARLADGDSLTCESGDELRLIGIDAPERSQSPFGMDSLEALDDLIGREPLLLEYDLETRDRHGRLLAYARSGSTLINERMVRDGWALAFRVPPNDRYADRLRDAERAARSAGDGHWAGGGFECRPVDHRARRC